jgi:hypothetical protein
MYILFVQNTLGTSKYIMTGGIQTLADNRQTYKCVQALHK